MKAVIVLGTRPEIIKLAPIIERLKKTECKVVFSGQHYDYELGLRFFDELDLRRPDIKFKISKESPAKQIGEIISKLHYTLSKISPDTVIVQGDTNTALAGALCAIKMNIPVCHVESGLRSFDWRMPEEHNRIVIDHVSDFLFAPTQHSKRYLINENVHGKIFVTGNTVIDSIAKYTKIADKRSKLIIDGEYILLTMHRAENVDDKNILKNVLSAMIKSSKKVVFPVHPRTLKRLHQFGLHTKIRNAKNIQLIQPKGYFDFLKLMKYCSFVVSDSGGIQEEATSPLIRKRVLVIRKTTDRPESVEDGFSILVGTNKTKILKGIKQLVRYPKPPRKKSPYGSAYSSKKIINLIRKHLT